MSQKLCLHRDLYPEEAVRRGLADFGKLATLSLDQDGADWVIDVQDPHPHFADRLVDELANYILGLAARR